MSGPRARHRPIGRLGRGLVEAGVLAAAAALLAAGLQTMRTSPLPMRLPGSAWSLESKALWVSPGDARNLYDTENDLLFIDVRPRESYLEGHVPGAVSVPPERFDALYGSLEPWAEGRRLVVYGSADLPSSVDEVLIQLERLGHGSLACLPAGWDGWRRAGGSAEEGDDMILTEDGWDGDG
jgi:3-mercaptopyruvate sulfurtransferase SseA